MEESEISIPIEVLPFVNRYKGKTFVIKYGGSIMYNKAAKAAFAEDICLLKSMGVNIVIIHGGGPEISKWLKRAGQESKFINGLRVTDSATMEIVEMVLSGSVNKNISSELSRHGISAIGLSGKDCNLIKAKKKYLFEAGRRIDLGYVGEIASINRKFLLELMEIDHVPVISPIGTDNEGNSYNINADFAAAFISSILKAEKLIIMTDIKGVYKDITDPSTFIPTITIDEINDLIQSGDITDGMIPKLECCIEAIENGAKNVDLIDGRVEHALLMDLYANCGTKIVSKGGISTCQKVI